MAPGRAARAHRRQRPPDAGRREVWLRSGCGPRLGVLRPARALGPVRGLRASMSPGWPRPRRRRPAPARTGGCLPYCRPDERRPPVTQRPALGCLFEVVETLVLTVVIFLGIQTFIAQPYKVQQGSMEVTLLPDQY